MASNKLKYLFSQCMKLQRNFQIPWVYYFNNLIDKYTVRGAYYDYVPFISGQLQEYREKSHKR